MVAEAPREPSRGASVRPCPVGGSVNARTLTVLLSLALLLMACATGGEGDLRSARDLHRIEINELAAFRSFTAYSAIQRLRPHWIPRIQGVSVSDGRTGMKELQEIRGSAITWLSMDPQTGGVFIQLKTRIRRSPKDLPGG